MKNILKILLILTTSLLPILANAALENTYKNKITLYGGDEYFYYYEILPNGNDTSDHTNEVRGNLPGGGLTFSRLLSDKINWIIDLSRFTGSPQSSNDQGNFYIPQSITDINTQLEYLIPVNKFTIIPFAQLGYRYWHRSVQGVTISQYSEYYYTNYYTVGLKVKFNITPKLSLTPYYGIGSTLDPRMRTSPTTINDADGCFYIPGEGTHLGKAVYKKFGLDINYQFNDHIQWYIGYDQNTFGFVQGHHNLILEPSSRTLQRLYKAGVTYSF